MSTTNLSDATADATADATPGFLAGHPLEMAYSGLRGVASATRDCWPLVGWRSLHPNPSVGLVRAFAREADESLRRTADAEAAAGRQAGAALLRECARLEAFCLLTGEALLEGGLTLEEVDRAAFKSAWRDYIKKVGLDHAVGRAEEVDNHLRGRRAAEAALRFYVVRED